MGSPKSYGGPFFVQRNMEIIQNEKYGIVYVTVQGKSETELNPNVAKLLYCRVGNAHQK